MKIGSNNKKLFLGFAKVASFDTIMEKMFLGSKSRLFFLYEKESLIGDNDISFKAGWMLAYEQN